MKNILLDTCAIIHIIRDARESQKYIDAIKAYDENANIIISVVTKAELESFIIQNNWGEKKKKSLNDFLQEVTFIDIANADIALIEAYSFIDAYSKRKIVGEDGNLVVGAARKMGKNDLWIAATAYVLDVPIITADGDFDHLNNTFLNVMKVL